MSAINRAELATVLRRARERVRPEDAGLPAGFRRRVAGLRREELALLAGISVDYVVRLEQGRGPHPSEQVLGALARALRLGVDERDELFRLAGVAPPLPGTIELHVRPSVLRLIDRFADLPTVVLSAKADVLAWNPMASALLGDWSSLAPEQRNLARLRFLPRAAGSRLSSAVAADAEQRAAADAQVVAGLRAASARYPRDPGLLRLLADLRAGSPEFVALWDAGGAGTWRSHRKSVDHPSLGRLTLDCDALHVPDCDQQVIVYSAAPGTPEAERLALLDVVGTQRLGTGEDTLSRAPASPGPAR